MSKLEERIRSDFLYYESLGNDEERFTSWGTRYDLQQIAKSLKNVMEKFDFVDDVRNEENVPDFMEVDKYVEKLGDKGDVDVTSN